VAAWVRDCIRGSLQRLQVASLHGLLLHRPQDLLGSSGAALSAGLAAAKSAGLVAKLGVSIYAPEELDGLASRMQLGVVQAPFSIVDRRLASSGSLARLHAAGTEVHVRSVFLQGLLLMGAGLRPARFARWQQLWDQWDRWLVEQALTPVQACLSFALSQPGIDRVVVGVDSRQQLQEILAGAAARSPAPPATLMSADLDLVNPSRWGAS
jgi:aryl-alcohol dehydrogenase-like predicted oxidoreductase